MNKGFILTAQYGADDDKTWTMHRGGLFSPDGSAPRVFNSRREAGDALARWLTRCPEACRPTAFHNFNIVEHEEDDTVALEDVPPGHLVERDSDGFEYVTINPSGHLDDGWSWAVTMRGRLSRLSRDTRVLDLGHVDDTTITTTK